MTMLADNTGKAPAPTLTTPAPVVADAYRFVIGVDTHARFHCYALVEAGTGRVLDEAAFPTSRAGLGRAAEWIGRRTAGQVEAVLVSCEGTGSYGARLAKTLTDLGYRVVDAPSPKRERGGNKNDTIDAIKAARSPLPKRADRLADVRNGELQEALKVLLAARERMSKESTRSINALTALLRIHDLGLDARRKPTRPQISQISRWRTRTESPVIAIARAEAVRLATRIVQLHSELDANKTQLRQIVAAQAPVLLEIYGAGPINAAIVLSVWSHAGRIHHEAALARIAGVSPIEMASGGSSEHRLNRGGDRQLNRALHSIAKTRMERDPDTQPYIERRTREGLSKRRIRRCLKRYIARQIFRTLAAANTPDTPDPALAA
ncbi:IS110 family transposase [Nocardioides sp.]|uniref:IS110 family transposase n=1 Tax=Nocardioides sp. TaxID=35761 RepID=UPI002C25058D|nr:IS110 family transposase [Nocardioides sp.]HXH78091.1 IS110 family transposase [Nocardioides sp.]